MWDIKVTEIGAFFIIILLAGGRWAMDFLAGW